MKTKILSISAFILLISSCVVKSLQPFYLQKHIHYEQDLVGKWKDEKNNTWEIRSFKEDWKTNNSKKSQLTEESLEAYEKYQNSYILSHKNNEREAQFIAVPFKVDNHLFLDLTPYEFQADKINPLAAQHLLNTHSAAYISKNSNGSIVLKWISNEVISRLINEGKLRIPYEKVGVDDELILTASSEVLHEFLRKFMKSAIDEKWKEEDCSTLTQTDA